MYSGNYLNNEGQEIVLLGEDLEDIQNQLPNDFVGRITIYDDHGFVAGWVGEGGWRYI